MRENKNSYKLNFSKLAEFSDKVISLPGSPKKIARKRANSERKDIIDLDQFTNILKDLRLFPIGENKKLSSPLSQKKRSRSRDKASLSPLKI